MKIELRRAAMTYQAPDGEVAALRDVTFGVADGEFVSIVGPSGCGKSTLLALIAGIEHPSGGEVLVDGEPVRAPTGKAGLMPQRDQLFDWRTIWGNVTLGLEVRHENTPARRGGVHDLLEQYQLAGFARKLPNQLSGGMRQRCALIRTLATSPDVLLLDEPLGALDLKLRKEMQLELKRLQREMNITFIYVTHDQEEALTMSDTVVVMNGGKVQQIGTPEDIYNEPKNAFVADFIGDSNIVDGVMHRDFLVSFSGVDFPCVDRGFAREQSVQVVVRPEDIEVVSPVEGQLVGVVNDVIFKGVHFEMHVECEGREWLIHSTRACTPGETIGMRIGPNEIHIMARSEG